MMTKANRLFLSLVVISWTVSLALVDTDPAYGDRMPGSMDTYDRDICDSGDPSTTCYINSAKTLDGDYVFNNLVIESGGSITHSANTGAKTFWLTISATNLTIEVGGSINVDGKGYAGGGGWASGYGPGAGTSSGQYSSGGGGAYGGDGGNGDGSGVGGSAYGSFSDPAELGSGGAGGASATGGAGGGLVILDIDNNLSIIGSISADGLNGGDAVGVRGGAGGGAGGGIYIHTTNWLGNGLLSAAGGGGGDDNVCCFYREGGGGGGGRIAVHYVDNSGWSGSYDISGGPMGGAGAQDGEVGTYYEEEIGSLDVPPGASFTLSGDESYFKITVSGGELFIDSNVTASIFVRITSGTLTIYAGRSLSTPELTMSGGVTTNQGTFNVTGNAYVTAPSTFNGVLDVGTEMIVSSTLTHSANTAGKTYWLSIDSADLTIEAGGAIDVDGKGYAGGGGWASGYGPGAGSSSGQYSSGGGGAYGGDGGNGDGSGTGGSAYGSFSDPADLGSGGAGGASATGGAGGGLVVLNVDDTLDLSGSITADGFAGGDAVGVRGGAGGGAGGGIYINTLNWMGNGLLRAAGGEGGDDNVCCFYREGGGGGGGRIAVHYVDKSGWSGSYNISGGPKGGAGAQDGYVGTYYEEEVGSLDVPPGASFTLSADESYFKITVSGGDLVIDSSVTASIYVRVSSGTLTINLGSSLSTPELTLSGGTIASHGTFEVTGNAYVTGSTTFNGELDVDGEMIISSTLTHSANTAGKTNWLSIDSTDLTIGAGGTISVDGRGYAGGGGWASGYGPGSGSSSGQYSPGGGGAYGGDGGNGDGTGVGGSAYGSFSQPSELGSGGAGGASATGGSGGGLVVLNVADALDVSGVITADGLAGGDAVGVRGGAGGGAGGGIYIRTKNWTGNGTLSASGGNGGDDNVCCFYREGGGGGGGRIAVYYVNKSGWTGSYDVNGGPRGGDGAQDGEVGTYYEEEVVFVDSDGDGIGDPNDNCPETHNPSQGDTDYNGVGDTCETNVNNYVGASSGDPGSGRPSWDPVSKFYEDTFHIENKSASQAILLPMTAVLESLTADVNGSNTNNQAHSDGRPPDACWRYTEADSEGTVGDLSDGTLDPGERISRIWRFYIPQSTPFSFWANTMAAALPSTRGAAGEMEEARDPVGFGERELPFDGDRFFYVPPSPYLFEALLSEGGGGVQSIRSEREDLKGFGSALDRSDEFAMRTEYSNDDGTAEIYVGSASRNLVMAGRFDAPAPVQLRSVSLYTSGTAAGDWAEMIVYEDPTGSDRGPGPSMEVARIPFTLGYGGFQEVGVGDLLLNAAGESGAIFYVAVANVAARSCSLGVDLSGPIAGASYLSTDGGETFEPLSSSPIIDGIVMIRAQDAQAPPCFVSQIIEGR